MSTPTIDIVELADEEPPSGPSIHFDEEFTDVEDAEADYIELSEDDAQFIHEMILKIMVFSEDLTGRTLFPYQREVAYRVIESVVLGDSEEITILQARQSGKSETLSIVIAGLMVLLPRLAKAYPDLLKKFKDGLWVGVFAPTEGQAETVWGRVHDWLTSDKAKKLWLDPEIDEKTTKTGGKAKVVSLRNSGSLCRMQTANARAKIESKSYHFVLIDEAQDVDEEVINRKIAPTLAFYNGTRVMTGTPNRVKSLFQKTCMANKRRQTRGGRRNHFEFNYKYVCRYNQDYKKYIAREKARYGEDSDYFQMSYNIKWILEEGMFVTEDVLMALGDIQFGIQPTFWHPDSPVVVGVDPARTHDSTVVTVVWVDWNRPDSFGFFEHRVLNWLEITNKPWERQYYEIVRFLQGYNVLRIGVDAQGMGSNVAERLQLLMPETDVRALTSDSKNQSERWKHLKTLIERQAIIFPASAKTRRLRSYKRFVQQMTDLETIFQGNYLLAAAPDSRDAYDDYADSLACACYMTIDDVIETAEVSTQPLYGRRSRR